MFSLYCHLIKYNPSYIVLCSNVDRLTPEIKKHSTLL